MAPNWYQKRVKDAKLAAGVPTSSHTQGGQYASVGSAKLQRKGGPKALATRLGKSVPTLVQWRNGTVPPTEANRRVIQAVFPDIRIEDWAERDPSAIAAAIQALEAEAREAMGLSTLPDALEAPSGQPGAGPGPSPALTTIQMAGELQRLCEAQLRALRADLVVGPKDRAQVMASLSVALERLAKVTGEADLTKNLTKTPLWIRLESELMRVLSAHPAVAAEVAEVFRTLS